MRALSCEQDKLENQQTQRTISFQNMKKARLILKFVNFITRVRLVQPILFAMANQDEFHNRSRQESSTNSQEMVDHP